jgi:hypothetical protein
MNERNGVESMALFYHEDKRDYLPVIPGGADPKDYDRAGSYTRAKVRKCRFFVAGWSRAMKESNAQSGNLNRQKWQYAKLRKDTMENRIFRNL